MQVVRTLSGVALLLLLPLGGCSSASDRGSDEDTKAEDTTPDPDGDEFALKSGLTISRITVNQAVSVDVVKDGKAVKTSARTAPIVSGKASLVRVFVTPDDDWAGKAVRAVLTVESKAGKAKKFEDTKALTAESTDAELESTFTFEVDGKSLPEDARFLVTLYDGKGKSTTSGDPIRYPASGKVERLGVVTTLPLNIVVVPVQYDADGSSRLPDVSDAQIEIYRQRLATFYPASSVAVTIHEPMPFPSSIQPNGQGFDVVLDAISQLRQADGVATNVYYYGVFQPTDDIGTFCRGGCVAGLSGLNAGTYNDYMRASVGLGYAGDKAADTMVHELGHAHGRSHAPCGGAASPDPEYPYTEAQIGAWGWDPAKKLLVEPTTNTDMMGYCDPRWISDFTYKALYTRIEALETQMKEAAAEAEGATSTSKKSSAHEAFRVVRDDGAGTVALGRRIELRGTPSGGKRGVVLHESGGRSHRADVAFVPYDHLPGGVYFVPEGNTLERIEISGAKNLLSVRH